MSTFTDLEKDAASVDGFVNENGLIPTRRNGPKPSYQYLVDRWNAEIAAAILEMNKSRGFRVVGTFVDGFTYELFNDVGIDADGNSWIYVGASAPNKVVAAGTVPSVGAGYEQVTFNAASGVLDSRGTNVQDYIDGNLTPFKTVADMKDAAYLSTLPEFTRIEWQGYYAQSDGGSNWGVLKFGAHTDDGGSIFSIDANTYVEANLKGEGVNIRKFGAVGDGITDDTGRVQAAVNYTSISIPSGNFRITGDIDVVNEGATIKGLGSSSLIALDSNTANGFTATSVDGITIDNVTIERVSPSAQLDDITVGNGIWLAGCKKPKIINNTFKKMYSNGVRLDDCNDYTIDNNVFYGSYYAGPGGSQTALPTASDILCYSGVDGGFGHITNNKCLGNNSQGIYVNALGLEHEIVISNNIVIGANERGDYIEDVLELNRRHGILLSYSSISGVGIGRGGNFVCTGNVIANTLWTGIYKALEGEANSKGSTINDNVIYLAGRQGDFTGSIFGGVLLIGCGASDTIVGNSIYEFRGTKAEYGSIRVTNSGGFDSSVNISSNNIYDSSGCGISINLEARDVVCSNNIIKSTIGYGIRIESGASIPEFGDFIVSNNLIKRSSDGVCIGIPNDVQRGMSILNNTVIGNSGVSGSGNTGVFSRYTDPKIVISGNTIKSCAKGYDSAETISGRNILPWDNNRFYDCDTAWVIKGADANASAFIQGSYYSNVVTYYSGDGFSSNHYDAVFLSWNTVQVLAAGSTLPTTTPWVRGDQIYLDAPSSGNVGAVRNQPNTAWVTF